MRYQPTEKKLFYNISTDKSCFLFVQIQLPQEGRGRTNVEHVGAYYAQIREGIILRNIFCVSAASQFRERRRRGGGGEEKRENKNNNPSQEGVLGLRRLRPPPPPRVECVLSKQEGGKVCELPAHAAKWEIARWGKRKGEGRIFMGNQIPGAGKGGRGHSTIN